MNASNDCGPDNRESGSKAVKKPDARYFAQAVAAGALIVILVIAAMLRLRGIEMPMSYDEILQYRRAALDSPFTIIKEVYYSLSILLSHYSLVLGHTPEMLRLPNFIGGLLAIYLIYVLVSQISGRAAALAAAAILTVSPYHIYHSQDARYYGIMSAIWVFHLITIMWYAKGYSYAWVLYFITLIAGLFNHPFFSFYAVASLAGFAAYTIFFSRSDWRSQLRNIAIPCSLLLLACAALYLSLLYVRHSRPQTPPEFTQNFKLHLKDYSRMLTNIGTPYGTDMKLLWYGAATLGFIFLFVRSRVIAMVTFFAIIVMPVPLFFIPVKHWYDERYFMPFSVLFSILVAMTIGEVASLPRQFNRPLSTFSKRTYNMVRILSMATSIGLTIILIKSSPQTAAYKEKLANRSRWVAVTAELNKYIQPSDEILHNVPPGSVGQPRMLLRGYALNRMEAFAEDSIQKGNIVAYMPEFSTNHQFGIKDADDVLSRINKSPYSNIWLVEHNKNQVHLLPIIADLFSPVIAQRDLALRVLGEPTANMVVGGGIEMTKSSKTPGILRLDDAKLVNYTNDSMNDRCLQLKIPGNNTGTARVALELKPPGIQIRNSNFELWKNGSPVGWQVEHGQQFIAPAAGQHRDLSALQLTHGTTASAALKQQLDGIMLPGSEVKLQAALKASGPNVITVALKYADSNGTQTLDLDLQASDGKWKTYTKSAKISPSAYADSFYIEIIKNQDSPQPAAIDNISLEIIKPSRLFNQHRSYYLSLNAKGEQIIPGEQAYWHQARIQIIGTTSDNQRVVAEVGRFSGTFDWTDLHFPIDTAAIKALSYVTKAEINIVLVRCSGTLWVDNIQLEQNDHPTPFTEDVRPPHDETIAGLDYALPAKK